MTDYEARISRLENQQRRHLNDMEALKLLLEQNNTSLAEFIELAKAFKFGMKILAFLERAAVFITKMTLAWGSLWAAWKFLVREALERALK